MRTLKLELGERTYPIHIGPGLIRQGSKIAATLPAPRAVVVTNETVAPLHQQRLCQGLQEADVAVLAAIQLPDGEAYKTLATLEALFNDLVSARVDRKTTLITLGGGVIGDLGGFAAASFQRGIPWVQVPTTLLAQVDAAVGGKTGVNHPSGKNLIGAFYQPRAVFADTEILATLPERELRAGFAEVIKYGLIRDPDFFSYLETYALEILEQDPVLLTETIFRSCWNKAEVVAADEREAGQRALLNLGHTFAHAIETGTGYARWLHGEAVAAGMSMAAEASYRLGWLSRGSLTRIRSLIDRSGLPVAGPSDLTAADYLRLMGGDKKAEAGQVRYVLLEAIGRAFLTADVPPEVIRATIEAC